MPIDRALEKAPCSCSISLDLQKYIDYFTILIHSSLQVVLFVIDLHEDLINEEGILDISVTEIKSVVQPDCIAGVANIIQPGLACKRAVKVNAAAIQVVGDHR